MTNLREALSKAAEKQGSWHVNSVGVTLATAAGLICGARVDWEPEDEEWGRVLGIDGSPVAIVCRRVPLGIASVRELIDAIYPNGVTWVYVTDMTEPVLSVDKGALELIFGRELSDNVNYQAISAQDLWWATV